MSTLFVLVFLASFPALAAGLIRPRWVLPGAKAPTRKLAAKVYGGVMFGSFILTALTSPKPESYQVAQAEPSLSVTPAPASPSVEPSAQTVAGFAPGTTPTPTPTTTPEPSPEPMQTPPPAPALPAPEPLTEAEQFQQVVLSHTDGLLAAERVQNMPPEDLYVWGRELGDLVREGVNNGMPLTSLKQTFADQLQVQHGIDEKLAMNLTNGIIDGAFAWERGERP